ncbi:hypothetical protein VCRA2128O102_10004 [Vibrio crassostreae]|nr:hypothetical protein VCRA2126O86_120020 [Vibrio crassostreae]CAK2612634.1 hypothetical protein VCRA2126O84_130018 [Vibrio crassostreae]CAK3182211.1 hypothetical protein VCRA2128O102_10004 [Vibrio crassostreae]CAK3202433.1 hypothetical protein VCRA2128O107_130004 [Vibrio crassostreae]CAK3721055.1 hypothetical protein VCRA2128O95_150004 [Vibrio crassostreae]
MQLSKYINLKLAAYNDFVDSYC